MLHRDYSEFLVLVHVSTVLTVLKFDSSTLVLFFDTLQFFSYSPPNMFVLSTWYANQITLSGVCFGLSNFILNQVVIVGFIVTSLIYAMFFFSEVVMISRSFSSTPQALVSWSNLKFFLASKCIFRVPNLGISTIVRKDGMWTLPPNLSFCDILEFLSVLQRILRWTILNQGKTRRPGCIRARRSTRAR